MRTSACFLEPAQLSSGSRFRSGAWEWSLWIARAASHNSFPNVVRSTRSPRRVPTSSLRPSPSVPSSPSVFYSSPARRARMPDLPLVRDTHRHQRDRPPRVTLFIQQPQVPALDCLTFTVADLLCDGAMDWIGAYRKNSGWTGWNGSDAGSARAAYRYKRAMKARLERKDPSTNAPF